MNKLSAGSAIKIAVGAVVILAVSSSFYTVDEGHMGVVFS